MRLAKDINRRLSSLRDELEIRESISYRDLHYLVTRAVKSLGGRVVLTRTDMPPDDIGVGGCFVPQRKRCPIDVQLFVTKRRREIFLSPNTIDNLIFALFETISHELIHRDQYTHRKPDATIFFILLDNADQMTDRQKYLAEVDEIDAYAHDIAIEMMYRRPKTYMDDLRRAYKMEAMAWRCYEEAFEGTQWSDIRQRLLKKVFLHIQRIREYNEEYTCTTKFSR